MNEFDIIVVGAGPAGSAAATWAARNGASVALVDKAVFPRDKLCGGAVTERSRRAYQDIFDQDIDLSAVTTKHDAELWAQGHCLGVLEDVPPIHLAMRISFDARMQQRALDFGVHDFSGQSIVRIKGTSVKFENHQALKAQILIGADGVKSPVARSLFGRAFDPATIGFALEAECPPIPALEDQPMRIDFDAAQWGYGWRFPKANSTTIGVGGLLVKNPDMKNLMRSYANQLGIDTLPKVKGHHLPFGYFRRRPGKGAVLLAGDAAGLVDPITGEGIAYALISGQKAAQAALEAIAAGKPKTAFRRYRRNLRKIHLNLRIARGLRKLVFSPRFSAVFFQRIRHSGTMRYDYMRLLAGELEYPSLLRKALTRLPGFLVRQKPQRSEPQGHR